PNSFVFFGSILSGATLDKFGKGQLILEGANTYSGITDIQDGWVTIQNNQSLGGRLPPQPEMKTVIGYTPLPVPPPVLPNDYVYATHGARDAIEAPTIVEQGAALHLKPLNPGSSMSVNENLILFGNGITHPFSDVSKGGISQEGALMSLDGNNTITGNVALM